MAARAALPQKPAAASRKKDGRTLVDLRSVRDERPPSGFPLAGSATGGMRAGEGGDFRGTFRASLSRDLRHLETGSHSRSFVSGTAIPLSSPFLLTGPTADTREESIVFHTRWLPGCLHCDRRKLPPLPPFPLLPTVLFDVCRLLNVIEGVPPCVPRLLLLRCRHGGGGLFGQKFSKVSKCGRRVLARLH